ncbi:unnamed protein product [Dicrocoelium dendriticum]|nr:unnamed protein product [Dicrocoelium dendriticum]
MDGNDDRTRSADESNDGPEDGGVKTMKSGRHVQRRKADVNFSLQVPASPPTFVTMRQLTEAANAFYNMSLAHEITVDSDFRIEKYELPEESLEHTVKETLHRAFWDLLRSSLEADPPDYQPALRLLMEIKQSLNGLVLPNQKTLQKLIESSLDLDVANAQLQQTGHLSLETYAIQVINLMRQFCAPVRDKEVEDLRKIDDPVEAFRQAFIVLEKMHMDLANFTITQMRPYIRQQAVNYERAKFADFLEAQRAIGIDALQHTRKWIQDAYRVLAPHVTSFENTARFSVAISRQSASSAAAAKTPPERVEVTSSDEEIPLTPNNILREAYLSLLTWPANKEWPETMVMDQQRLLDLGTQLVNIVTLTSMILVICNFVASNATEIFAQPKLIRTDPNMMLELKRMICNAGILLLQSHDIGTVGQKSRLFCDEALFTLQRWLAAHMDTDDESVPDESGSSFTPLQACHLISDSLQRTLTSQVDEVVRGRHPVYLLMLKRALTFLRAALSSHPPESLALPPGFSVLSELGRWSHTSPSVNPHTCPPSSSQCATSSAVRPVTSGIGAPEGVTLGDEKSPKRPHGPESLSLTNLASRLFPLLTHNRHVFGPHYAEIIQAILLPRSNLATPTTERRRNTKFKFSISDRSRSSSERTSSRNSEAFDSDQQEDETTFILR